MNKAKILIVEDEVLLAADMEDNLLEAGYDVVGLAHSGSNAIKMALETEPDLILMDIQLKDRIDGIQAANEIKKKLECAIVFQTAFADDPYLIRATESEPFGYLVKPVAFRELKATIRMALYKAKMEKERETIRLELEKALEEIKTLRDFLPVCAWCKKVRDDEGYWEELGEYLKKQIGTTVSHGICPDCAAEFELKNG